MTKTNDHPEPVSLGPRAAYDLIESDPRTVFVDVRSTMEFLFVGHPVGAVHVPWIDEPEWTRNRHFVTDIRKLVLGGAVCLPDGEECVPVVLICRSGKRSREAGILLLENGFNRVYNVEEGFEGDLDEQHHRGTQGGWRYHGLPWEQC
jgi:rhodanese-related sulfurtransferase